MGWNSIASFIDGAISSICSEISSICSSIGNLVLGEAVSSFVFSLGISKMFPVLDIVNIIMLVVDVVVKIAESLGLKKEKEDEPDELAMKAEKDDKKPEDFDSIQEYIKHLQEDIQLTKEEKEKLEQMSPEEKSAYHSTGTYIYIKAINEKLGFDKSGLKDSKLVGITPEVLADLVKIQNVISPSDFVVYNKCLQQNGVGIKEFSDYLHNRSKDLATDEKVQDALINAMKELSPNITNHEINQNLYQLNIKEK